ncbi:hypothetical protein [Maribacter luteus]|uniref:Uncharacterized protein n=1 Tax=Maribacter luteus TaxID=2594478 RepID=A0A6I2MLN1_9FLAO|nr:hypothetical protein [Maribacter luteus]MRX64711.1 hypothetical protein [Maribacter luteus]
MNCYKHPSLISVSKCMNCGRGLCPECTDRFAMPTCEKCSASQERAKKNIKKINKSSIVFEMVITLSVGFAFCYLIKEGYLFDMPKTDYFSSSLDNYIFFGLGAGVVSAYYTLPTIQSLLSTGTAIWGGCFFWFIIYFLKFFIAMSIGIYILPFRVIYNIYRLFE